ncbi:cadmium resistance transporter [Shimia sagamensis]|uniref:Cadmium resistance protein CadD, predicted permease n=1 Tax=Shimia sagamensis TaxID=1566352 RepID=A0ABY1P1Q9_9RHOB|nr:cadmium resistance transporter [Shimia sagamensis]SMP23789.1 Cadmium resistance protein CadD, predicted permease [Shimia sagamensis]
MIDEFGIALSAVTAHVATNLDNLAIMVGLILTVGQLRTLSGYLIAQGMMLSAAYFVSAGLETGLPHQVGYLGFIPIGLGLYALVGRYLGADSTAAEQVSKSHVLAIIALFLSVSFDSFAVFTPLLADSGPSYTAPILFGAGLSVVGLAVGGAALASMAPAKVSRLERLEWLAPYVMIAIGLYVVINTGTDIT